MGISESLTCFAEALASMATQGISQVTDDLVEAREAMDKFSNDQNTGDGPMLSDSRVLLYSFQRWYQIRESVPTALGGFLDARALLQDFRTWYLGNRHLLPSSKRRSLDERMQPREGMQDMAALPATPAQAAAVARTGLQTPGYATPGAAVDAPPVAPAVAPPVAPRCTIAALRRTWAEGECRNWSDCLKDMDAQLPVETWFLGWSERHYGHGIKQACCGTNCPRGFKPIGKTALILYS